MAEPNAGDQAFRREELFGRNPEMTFGGALSFLRRNYTKDLNNVDIAVTGIPFDMATSNRPGTRFGPRAIRAGSVGLAELEAYPFGFDPFDHVAVADYGDCFIDYGYPQNAPELIELHAEEILSSNTMMLSMGGDHYITYPILKAHAKKHGPLSLIHFDAHCDTWVDDGRRMDHGSMFLRALNEGIIDPTTSVQIGIRTHNSKTYGFTVLGAPWIHREGIPAAIDVLNEVVGENNAYLTFDIDCLDPAFAPGTGTPVAGGLSSAQALEAIRSLGDFNIVGMDIVEVAPIYDVGEITSIAAATLLHDFICLQAIKAGATPEPFGRT